MGLGFLSSEAKGSRKMEDVGEEYLNSLVAQSFFQECKTGYPEEEAVKMHDIIHDFAQYLTKNESLVFLGDGGGSRKIRHLNVPSRQVQLSTLSINMEYLWTLLLRGGDSSDDDYSAVLLKLSRARVLKLKGSMICMIPSEIGKLTHLRYINSSHCRELKELPESICDLFALQTLDISWCTMWSFEAMFGYGVAPLRLKRRRAWIVALCLIHRFLKQGVSSIFETMIQGSKPKILTILLLSVDDDVDASEILIPVCLVGSYRGIRWWFFEVMFGCGAAPLRLKRRRAWVVALTLFHRSLKQDHDEFEEGCCQICLEMRENSELSIAVCC